MGLTDQYGSKNNLGEGSFSIEVNKVLLNAVFFKVGVRNLTFWGLAEDAYSAQKSYFASGTILLVKRKAKPGTPFSLIAFTAGAGNGLFRKTKDFTNEGSGHFNPFYSIATTIFCRTNFIAEWSGYDFSTGIDSYFKLSKKQALSISFERTDYLLKRPRYVLGLSYCISLIKNNYYDPKM
jgi:hypothetical protein